MKKIGTILKNYDPKIDKHISREFQSYGIKLAEDFDDYSHRGLYIRLAKIYPRSLLEKAYSFVIDSTAKNKGALFMWKLKELKSENANLKSTTQNSKFES